MTSNTASSHVPRCSSAEGGVGRVASIGGRHLEQIGRTTRGFRRHSMTKKYGVFPFSMIGKYFIKDSIKIYQSLSEAIKLKEILNVTTKENYVIEDLHYCED